MKFEIGCLGSGSKGNSVFIKNGKTCLICDQGLSVREFVKRAKGEGLEKASAIILTHEHYDHIRGVEGLALTYNLPIFVHERALKTYLKKVEEGRRLKIRTFSDTSFELCDLEITPFRIPHDTSYPVGFSVSNGKEKVSVATDLGRVTDGIYSNLKGSDAVIIESNHDIELLKNGKYPETLKKRILSDIGHLSNGDGTSCAARLIKDGTKGIIFAHLSEENNTKMHVQSAVEMAFSEYGIKSGDATVIIAGQKESCRLWREQ